MTLCSLLALYVARGLLLAYYVALCVSWLMIESYGKHTATFCSFNLRILEPLSVASYVLGQGPWVPNR